MRPTMYFGAIAQEDHGQREHQDRPDDPVPDEGQPEDLAVPEDPRQPRRTFASGGYIIRTSPTARGIEVVLTDIRSSVGTTPGTRNLTATPAPMARKIQSVR